MSGSKNGKALTYQTGSEKYIAELTEAGSAEGTVGTYTRCLANCAGHFGKETLLADIDGKAVESFLKSKTLNQTPGGKPKSAITIAQNVRVVRQMFDWAVSKGIMASNPFPAAPAKEPKAPKPPKEPKAPKAAKPAKAKK